MDVHAGDKWNIMTLRNILAKKKKTILWNINITKGCPGVLYVINNGKVNIIS